MAKIKMFKTGLKTITKKWNKLQAEELFLPSEKMIKNEQYKPRLYDTPAWRTCSKRFLAENPLCVFCKKKGIIKTANVIAHIIPHRGDKALFWDENNWQPLCYHCHNSIKKRIEKRLYGL